MKKPSLERSLFLSNSNSGRQSRNRGPRVTAKKRPARKIGRTEHSRLARLQALYNGQCSEEVIGTKRGIVLFVVQVEYGSLFEVLVVGGEKLAEFEEMDHLAEDGE